MQNPTAIQEQLSQLRDLLQSPIAHLEPDNQSATLLNARQMLEASAHCCIVVATSTNSNKFKNIKNLYRGMAALKSLQRQLCKEYPPLHASLIGVYPSLESPACVYELNTNADGYIARNVLPYAGSPLVNTLKHLVSKLLGANPAVGGLGLTLYKE